MDKTINNGFLKLYDQMLSDPRIIHQLSQGKATLLGGSLDYLWGIADEDIYYVSCMLHPINKDVYIGRVLVFADYLTYVPYGEIGYEKLDNMFEENKSLSVSKWRWEHFQTILKEKNILISSDVLESIETYFKNYPSDKICKEDISSIARAICRIRHSFEAYYKKEQWDSDAIDNAQDFLLEKLKEKETISLQEILYTCPKLENLDEEQMAFLQRVMMK